MIDSQKELRWVEERFAAGTASKPRLADSAIGGTNSARSILLWFERNETYIWSAAIVAVVLRSWLMSLNSTLWLDEAGSVWAIHAGITDIARRAIHFPQSIAMSYLLWLSTTLFGMKEWALRLPSFLASLGSLFLFYRLSIRYLDRTASLLGLAIWCLSGETFTLGTEARPYALAMLCVVASLWQLHRWLDNPSFPNFLFYAVLVVACCYFVLMFAFTLAAHTLFLGYKVVRGRRMPRWQLSALVPLWVFLLLPLVPQISAIRVQAALHAIPKVIRSREDLIPLLVPPAIALCHLGAWIFGRFFPFKGRRSALPLDGVVLSMLFMLCAAVPLYVITRYTPATLWTYRYMCSMSFGFALLHSGILISYTSAAARCFGILCMATIVFPTVFSLTHFWPRRSAVDYPFVARTIARERKAMPTEVFMSSEFVEGWTWPFPTSAEDQEWLLAPFILYSPKGPVQLIPNDRRQAPELYFEQIRSRIDSADRFIFFGPAVPMWFSDIIGDRFAVNSLGRQRAFFLFERKNARLSLLQGR